MAKANKGGRKLSRGTKRRAKTAFQVARTLKNKHNAAARRTRRREYWRSEEGQKRKADKAVARKTKDRRNRVTVLPLLDNINAPSPLDVPVMKLDTGTVTGHRNDDLRLRGYPSQAGYMGCVPSDRPLFQWENEGGLIV